MKVRLINWNTSADGESFMPTSEDRECDVVIVEGDVMCEFPPYPVTAGEDAVRILRRTVGLPRILIAPKPCDYPEVYDDPEGTAS